MHKVLQQFSPDKLVAIQFILASSINFDDVFDTIHSPEDVDCLTAERIAYVKNQEVDNLAEDKSDESSSSINSQNDVNYINHDFDFIDGVDVPTEHIEGKVDNYSIEYPITYTHGEVDFQSIDECETVKLQDVPTDITNEQEIEECMQEEVVTDMTLPEVYRVDTEIHTDVQLETPIIKSEEKCVMKSKPKLVQDMTLLHDTPTPLETNAQPITKQKVSLPDRAILGKLISITHASWGRDFEI